MCHHIVFTITFQSTNKTSIDPVYFFGEEGMKVTEEVARHYSIYKEAGKGVSSIKPQGKGQPRESDANWWYIYQAGHFFITLHVQFYSLSRSL